MPFDVLNEELRLLRIERNTLARRSSPRRPPRPMNVGLCLLGRLKLDYEVYVRNIQPPRSHIRRDEHLELVLLEPLHGDLTLVLRNIAVHHLDVLLNLVGEDERVSIGFGLGEDDGFAFATVAYQDISQRRQPVLERTRDSQMTDRPRRLILKVLTQINNPQITLHVLRSDVTHPARNSRGEETNLEVFGALAADCFQDLVYVLLESELEHLISLVQHDRLNVAEVDVTALNMVEHATRRPHKEVDAAAQFARLVLHGDASVDSQG